jgi:hypothetical protein
MAGNLGENTNQTSEPIPLVSRRRRDAGDTLFDIFSMIGVGRERRRVDK